jgi:hypothetical protein
MIETANGHFLSNEAQEAYWAAISPDIRGFLNDFESRESWTYSFDEFPRMFIELSSALPKLSEIGISEDSSGSIKPILKELIVILANMPMRQAIAAVATLDKSIKTETDIGWGVAIYMAAAQVALHGHDHPNYAEYKILHERINIILYSRLSSLLFVQLKALGEKS